MNKKIIEVLNHLSQQTSLVVNEEKITKISKIDFYKMISRKSSLSFNMMTAL